MFFSFHDQENLDITRKFNVANNQFPSITLGNVSYAVEIKFESYDQHSHILIGKYCSIAHDVKCLFAMNHDYRTISTSAGIKSEHFKHYLKDTPPPRITQL